MKRVICVIAAAAAVSLAGPGQPAGAAGFALIEHGVSGLGNAYAGGAAIAADPTTVFFNPAGMTRLSGKQLSLAFTLISPAVELDNDGSTVQVGNGSVSIAPTPGADADGGEAGTDVMLPSFYYTQALSDRFSVGLAVDAPFGLATEYDAGWVGRYHAIKSHLRTFNVNPAVAWKATDALSVGAGVSAIYADVQLSRAIDGCATLPSPPFGPGTCDARWKVSGDDLSLGFNLGLLYELSEQTRLGFAWRTWDNPDLEGDLNLSFAPGTPQRVKDGFTTVAGLIDGAGVQAELPLPDTLSASLHHAFSPQWAVMADVTWTEWSVVDTINIEYDTGAVSPLELDYQDAFRYGVGLTYTPDARWTWRAGVAYDEEPVRNARTRTARLPGNDRLWLAVGGRYSPHQDLSLDFGYAHLFVDDTRIDNQGTSANGSVTHTLRGDYDLAVDIVGVQANWRFD